MLMAAGIRIIAVIAIKRAAFVQPDFTAAQMQTFCIEKMKETGMPGFVGWLLTRNIPKLERWKNS